MNPLPILPEALLALGIILALVFDAAGQGRLAWLSALAAVAGGAVAALVVPHGPVVDGLLATDALGQAVRLLVLPATFILLLTGNSAVDGGQRRFAIPILAVALGALVAGASVHVVPLFLGLELMSLASYCLAAWSGTRRNAEAAMKYVLFGGVASAIALFGLGHVYGLTGHLDFAGIATALKTPSVGASAALACAGASLLAKLAVVPLHLYAPDVYQGAPPLAVTVFASLPKIAVIAVFGRLIDLGIIGGQPVLSLLAIATIVWAAAAALSARDSQRILAFSALGHAGSALLVVSFGATASALWYLAAYLPSAIGAFAVLGLLADRTALEALRGSGRRRPILAGVLILCIVSLVGVPPFSGFFAKWHALAALARTGGTLALVGATVILVATATTAWAYLRIVRAAVLEPGEGTAVLPVAPRSALLGLALCVALTLGLGLWLDGPTALGLVGR